jgi:hypothetical protein
MKKGPGRPASGGRGKVLEKRAPKFYTRVGSANSRSAAAVPVS